MGGGQGDCSSLWVSGGQGNRRIKGQRRRLKSEGTCEEEEISEIQTRKDGKEWDIGELRPGRQGWCPRLCMNNQVSYIVPQVRLRWSPESQDPSITMRELTTQGKNFLVSPFYGQFPRKIHLQCHWFNLHPLGQSPPDTLTKKPRADVVLNL